MTKVIAFANQKGGVGKTTMASQTGYGLVKEGKKVLLIDCDPQADLTKSLGVEDPDSLGITLSELLLAVINDEGINPCEGVMHHDEGVDFVPANIELSGMEVTLVNVMSRELILKEYINTIKDECDYDYILIDCMPSLGMLTMNALAAADSVIIPSEIGYYSVKGLQQLIKTIFKVKRQLNPGLKIEGIVMTMVDTRSNYTKDIMQILKESYSDSIRVFETYIPMCIKAKEVGIEGKSIFLHAPREKVTKAFEQFVKEVLDYER